MCNNYKLFKYIIKPCAVLLVAPFEIVFMVIDSLFVGVDIFLKNIKWGLAKIYRRLTTTHSKTTMVRIAKMYDEQLKRRSNNV